MAFNKGLKFYDASTVGRFSLTATQSTHTFFESVVTSAGVDAYGGIVLTIRPAAQSANTQQTLIAGDNLAIGIEYNAAGDEYRLMVQDGISYANNVTKFALANNTQKFGAWAAVDAETTFGLSWNSNGTGVLLQTGEAVQSLSLSAWTAVQNDVALTATGQNAVGEQVSIVLDDGKGNIVEVSTNYGPAAQAADATALMTAVQVAFASLSDEQKGGFEISDDLAGTLTITREDGASFEVYAGDAKGDADLDNSIIRADGAALPGGSVGGSFSMATDYEGFISQIAEFNRTLSLSELQSYVTSPESVPDPAVNSDGQIATLVIDGIVTPEAADYVFQLSDGQGNSSVAISYTGDGSTASEILAGLQSVWDAKTDAQKAGFSVESIEDAAGDTVQLTISREDGADFKFLSVDGTGTDYTSGDGFEVNGSVLDVGDFIFSSSSINAATIEVEESAAPTGGELYEIVLDDGTGNTETHAFFVDSTLPAANDAAAGLAGVINTDSTEYSGAAAAGVLTITRADGQNFSVKLGPNDEAGSLEVDTESLTKDSAISSFNGTQSGVIATLSNGVKQNFDFTTLTNADEIVSGTVANYAGEATISLSGIDKTTGNTLADLTSGNSFTVSTEAYTGSTVVSTQGAVDSEVLFAQVRDVSSASAANRTMVLDLFVDPKLVGVDGIRSLSYAVNVDAGFSIDAFEQLSASGGYALGSPVGQDIEARWFKPTAHMDLSIPVASITVTDDGVNTAEPVLTFTSIDINGTDYSDGTTYTASYEQTIDTELFDVSGVLRNGLDETTGSADQLVIGYAKPGASSQVPFPSSGLYMDMESWSSETASTSPDATVGVSVISAVALTNFSFEVKLPAQTDLATVSFTPDDALSGWTFTANETEGRTLVVEGTGPQLAASSTLGVVSATIADHYDTVYGFDLVNVQTDTDAANETGRGLSFGLTRTDENGAWSLSDLPGGTFSRQYEGTQEVGATAVNLLDAFYALQVSAGLVPTWYNSAVTDGQLFAADFDGSGKVTAADALAILEYSVALTKPVPDPVAFVFYDDDSGTPTVEDTDALEALAQDFDLAADLDVDAASNDEVVLIGDISDPSI